MAASSSSSSGGSFKYDVFINFRGEDTRRCFVCHLYEALKLKALETFIDSEKLQKGDNLSELLKAIQESRLSIIVFSKNYASSTWCLKELVQILECIKRQNQIVVPIFYEVDPSHVRKLKESFAEAFAKHESDSNLDKEELESWKSSLTRATNLSGYDSKNYQDDIQLIESIVEDILKKVIRISPSKTDGLVGMDTHMNKIDSLFKLGVEDCRHIVGIWGMGGIGKSTIAKAVYEKYSPQFEHKCFLDNVKEGFLTKNGKVLLEDLLSRILKIKDRSTLDEGLNMMRERLGEKKILLVLDDVDKMEQIDTLIGENPSFGDGSRIIITTRDKNLLARFLVYEPELFTTEKALELFHRYAFRTIKPPKNYDEISRRAVEYAHGLPLALKVLGALLDNKKLEEWEYELKKIKKISITFLDDNKIGRVLQASYNGLDRWQKKIFLDIAFFFKGKWKWDVRRIHESCGFFPENGLRVLEERSLVTVSEYGRLEMHDLIQEMGREIVREESPEDLGRRSRLWYYEDVLQVLTQNTPAEAVESIILDLSKLKELCVNNDAFVGMKKLRMLQLTHHEIPFTCKQHVNGDLKSLSNELRVLVWHSYPLKSLPYDFQPTNLIKIDMRHSHIEQLWEGTKPLPNLVRMDLSHSKDLIKTPDLTDATNLKRLDLAGCTSLLEVHPSISARENLVSLNLRGCSNLVKFPNISRNMKELVELHLDETPITEMPSSINDLPGLWYLSLHGCRELRSLPSSIHMKSLDALDLSGCSKLEEFPEISEVMEKLHRLDLDGTAVKELPSSINNLTGLEYLSMSNCTSLVSLPSSIHMKSLEILDLSGCSKLEKFPEISEVMEKLHRLDLDGTAVKELPSSINYLTGLEYLSMRNCTSLVSLPSSIHMKSLETLDLSGCSKLEEFPEISEVMEKLHRLDLDGTAVKELASSINNLTGLRYLSMRNCTSLVSLRSSIHMKSLRDLDLSGCSKLEEFPKISEVMEKLNRLDLDGTAVKELPSSINNLTGLFSLSMRNCTSLVSLPDEICDLARLINLDLTGCSNLSKLPDNFQNLYSLGEWKGCLGNLEGSGIKQLPFCILRMKSLSCKGWKELTAPFSSWPTTCINPSCSILVHLDLSDCNLLEVSDAIAHLSRLQTLRLSRNKNLESLPAAMNRLPHLRELHLEDCKRLESIPELSSSIDYISADDCTTLVTVPTLQLQCVGIISFTFLNCLKLENSNLFMDIVETATDNQDCRSNTYFRYHISLPGSDIPEWFNHECGGSSVIVQLPPDWSSDKFQGFAICAISNLWGARDRKALESAFCCATFKENDGQDNFYFPLLSKYLGGTNNPLESNHMIMEYITSSSFGNWHSGRKYTQATFRIVTRDFESIPDYSKTWKDCTWITSCGVRLFQMNARSPVDHPLCTCFSLSGCTILLRKKQRETEREAEGVAGLESEEADVSGEGESSHCL